VKKQEREAFIKAVRECGLSLGEIVQEVEKKGMLGHFKSLKQSVYSSPEGGDFNDFIWSLNSLENIFS